MKGNRLYKSEKLCSRTDIDNIFREGESIIAYPLRVAYKVSPNENPKAKFLISIPKKKIRTAVGRVLLRRRTREAYRLNRELLFPAIAESKLSIDMAFMYLSKDSADYKKINDKMIVLLTKIAQRINPEIEPTQE